MFLICSCAYGAEKSRQDYGSSIGVGMSSGIIKKQTELSIGHAFSPNWSVSGRVSIALSQYISGYDEEEQAHFGEFQDPDKEGDTIPHNMSSGSAGVLYWPSRCYKGLYIRTGVYFGECNLTDIEVGAGFFFKIWKLIHADIAYDTLLISSFHSGRMGRNGIRISIHLKF